MIQNSKIVTTWMPDSDTKSTTTPKLRIGTILSQWLEQTNIMWTVHVTRSSAGFTSLYLINYIFALDLVHTIGDRTESR